MSDPKNFEEWYTEMAEGNPDMRDDPDDPLNYYDYRAYYESDVDSDHFPPEFMHDLHPDRFKMNKHMVWEDRKNGTTVHERTVIIQGKGRRAVEAYLQKEQA